MKWHYAAGLFWLRVSRTGPGLVVKDLRRQHLSFSERNGIKRVLRLGPLAFSFLPGV